MPSFRCQKLHFWMTLADRIINRLYRRQLSSNTQATRIKLLWEWTNCVQITDFLALINPKKFQGHLHIGLAAMSLITQNYIEASFLNRKWKSLVQWKGPEKQQFLGYFKIFLLMIRPSHHAPWSHWSLNLPLSASVEGSRAPCSFPPS